MLVEAIGNLLAGEGHGTLGTDLFLYQLPDEPDAVVAVREYEGGDLEFIHNTTRPLIADARFQVVCRATTIVASKTKAEQIWLTLCAQRNVVLDGVFFHRVLPLQSPFLLERDANDRWVTGCNYSVRKEVG